MNILKLNNRNVLPVYTCIPLFLKTNVFTGIQMYNTIFYMYICK